MRILLVEDEVRLTDALNKLLEKQNIDVDIANDGDSGLILAEKDVYDVIVLDIMLPGRSGLDILKIIRSKGVNTPVLLLTARDAIEDRVLGLDLGADDYLVKPFASSELIARIRSLSRRVNSIYQEQLSFGNIKYESKSHTIIINDETIELTSKEGQLLEMLIKRPNQIFTREQILDRVWGINSDVQENTIEFYIHHLRKKLSKKADVGIVTIRSVGYSLREK